MATLSKGYTFGASEQVTNTKLHSLVDSATIAGIVNADIDASAAIASSKLADIAGSKLTTLATITSGAGVIPAANLTSVAQKGANSDITSLTGLTTPLAASKGGTGATAAANAASGVVVLNASSQLPAVSGALLTNLPSTSLGSWVDKSASYGAQQAATDGFVVAYADINDYGTINIYTDASANPTTLRAKSTIHGHGTAITVNGTCPVKKGDYWKVTITAGTAAVYWIPLGS